MRVSFGRRISTFAGLLVAVSCLCGCPHPSTYGTPRTTPPGKIAHTVALEGFNISGNTTTVKSNGAGGTSTSTERQSFTLPTFPTYQIRVGLGDRLDIGGKVANLSSLGLDLKWNFLKSRSFDMAIDPGAQFFAISGSTGSSSTGANETSTVFIFYGHMPVLLGFNLSEDVTIVLSPGAVLSAGSARTSGGDRDALTTSTGLWGRLGLGFNFRMSKGFALHPEVTAMRQFQDNEVMMVLFGLGFNFGKLPDYSPGSENDAGEDSEGAKKPDPNAPAQPAQPTPAQPATAPATTPAPAQ